MSVGEAICLGEIIVVARVQSLLESEQVAPRDGLSTHVRVLEVVLGVHYDQSWLLCSCLRLLGSGSGIGANYSTCSRGVLATGQVMSNTGLTSKAVLV